MDIAQQLIRSVARAFYLPRHILVIDALMVHSALYVEDLASLLNMNTKDLRKLCALLREDKMLSVHSRQETREGQQRPVNKDYYFINYHMAIDSIKLRIVRLEKKVRDLYRPTQERKEYSCPRCGAEWTQMDVLSRLDFTTGEFLCQRCNGPLERNEVSAADRAGHERSSRLMSQLGKLVSLLQQVDNTDVPPNTFEQALQRQKPIERTDLNPSVKWEAVKKDQTSDIVRGREIEAEQIHVEITSEEATAKTESEAKKQRLVQHAANQLPEWYTSSTVTGQRTALGNQEAERMKSIMENLGGGTTSEEEKKPLVEQNDYVSDYYAQLAEAQAREAEREEVSEDEEDEDEDFENVPGLVGTPSSALSTNGLSTKRKSADSEPGSGMNTGFSTPITIDSPSKRVKISGSGAGLDDEDDEDEDEAEFEDAL